MISWKHIVHLDNPHYECTIMFVTIKIEPAYHTIDYEYILHPELLNKVGPTSSNSHRHLLDVYFKSLYSFILGITTAGRCTKHQELLRLVQSKTARKTVHTFAIKFGIILGDLTRTETMVFFPSVQKPLIRIKGAALMIYRCSVSSSNQWDDRDKNHKWMMAITTKGTLTFKNFMLWYKMVDTRKG